LVVKKRKASQQKNQLSEEEHLKKTEEGLHWIYRDEKEINTNEE